MNKIEKMWHITRILRKRAVLAENNSSMIQLTYAKPETSMLLHKLLLSWSPQLDM